MSFYLGVGGGKVCEGTDAALTAEKPMFRDVAVKYRLLGLLIVNVSETIECHSTTLGGMSINQSLEFIS